MDYTFDADYKKMYITLFNAVTDALEQMEKQNFGIAADIIKNAQIKCEDIFIEQ